MSINDYQALSSRLSLCFDSLEIVLDKDLPQAIYRDFDEKSHRHNFVQGNIWFSGPSQNRFFLQNEFRRDEEEYRNKIASYIFEYPLSFSIQKPTTPKPMIKISNVEGFIQGIANDIIKMKDKFVHTVSWLPIETLRCSKQKVPSIALINKYPSKDDEEISLWTCGITAYQVKYEQKIESIPIPYNSYAATCNARNKNIAHAHEQEWRIALFTGDFIQSFHGLLHLVQYLKVVCPSISKYCELIDDAY